MMKKYVFRSLGVVGISIFILFGFLISNVVASDEPTTQKARDEKIDEILKNVQAITVDMQSLCQESSAQNKKISIVFDENESPEGYTAPANFSREGYLSYADEIKLQRMRNDK